MNIVETEQFLSVVYNQYKQKSRIYLSYVDGISEGFFFYGSHNIVIEVATLTNTVNFTFKKPHNSNISDLPPIPPTVVELPFESCKNFISKAYNDYINLQNKQLYSQIDNEFIQQQQGIIKDYLQNTLLDNLDIEEDTIITIPNGYANTVLKLGSVLKNNMAANTSLIGLIAIPFTIYHEQLNEYQKNFTHLKLYIKGWEIENYPVLQSFIHIYKSSNNINDFLNNIIQQDNQLGQILHYHILEGQVPKKENIKKQYKL